MYNYNEAMKEDVLNYIHENINLKDYSDRDELEEKLNDELFTEDSVTGNASGSYTFNRWTAQEYVTENQELCTEALQEFCVPSDEIAEHFLNGDWEYFDVTIRCYLLSSAINEALDEISEEEYNSNNDDDDGESEKIA